MQGARQRAPQDTADAGAGSEKGLKFTPSRQFTSWLSEQGAALAFTTYQGGKVFFVGLRSDGSLGFFERSLSRCMGMVGDGNSLYISTLYQLWRFENVFPPGHVEGEYDRLFVPQVGYITGDLDVHDLGITGGGEVVFANTLFSCLATVSQTRSFRPVWKPKFISKLAAEDRCHLNGLAMRDGKPAFVTVVSESDVADGWRDRRTGGGCVIDVASNETVASGLSMPHSPRWHNDRLWVHNSGTGEFGWVDQQAGRFEPVAFCPGYLRGLCFLGKYAVMGLSKPRGESAFGGLPLQDALSSRDADARCALQVVDLETGDAPHWLRIEGMIQELYDVVSLPGVRYPKALGFKTDEIRRVISIEE